MMTERGYVLREHVRDCDVEIGLFPPGGAA